MHQASHTAHEAIANLQNCLQTIDRATGVLDDEKASLVQMADQVIAAIDRQDIDTALDLAQQFTRQMLAVLYRMRGVPTEFLKGVDLLSLARAVAAESEPAGRMH